jgi:hypothetical protein
MGNFNQILSKRQIDSLGLPVESKVLIELTNPANKEFGQITILADDYTLKLDSGCEEIIEAHEYLQERVNEGHRVRFAIPSDRPI